MSREWSTFIGRGVYSVSEASRYTQLHHARIYSWLRSRSDTFAPALIRSDYAESIEGRVLSFLDLIDVHVAGKLRNAGVSMQVVRRAYMALQDHFGAEHPFCHQELGTDGQHVFLRVADDVNDEKFYDVVSGQHEFPRVLKQFLKLLDHNQRTLMAEKWRIASGVVIDPTVSFGKPVVRGRATTTYVVRDTYYANKRDSDLVARMYRISPTAVMRAVRFEDRHPKVMRAA